MGRKGEKENGRNFAGRKKQARLFGCLILFLLFAAAPLDILAITPAEYREKLQETQVLVEDLLYLDEEDLSVADQQEYEREALEMIRQSLPSEKVEWQGTSIETNNAWLLAEIDEYEKEKKIARRQAILTGIDERLRSIEQKLSELESPASSGRSKDEDKRKLNEILRREEYQKPVEKEKSWIEKVFDKISEWFRREASDRSETQPAATGSPALSLALQILVYAVVLGAIGFLIYKFVPFVAKQIRRREKREKKERVILGERIAADESADDLFSEAERLAREGNLRGAIRKGYVALLCELSDRKVIGLSRHKTNRDYLRDVRRKRSELYDDMSGLTLNFERHWYGFEEADERDWEEFRNGYKKAVSGQ